MDKVALRFSKLTEHAFAPTKGSKLAAGYDLYSAYDYKIPSKGQVMAKTDINVAVPEGSYGRVAPRSGLALKHSIDVGAGVVDADYRGNLGVILFNFGDSEFVVKRGDRIAQLICEKIFLPELKEMEQLDDTARGEGGFGSTGVSHVDQNGSVDAEATANDVTEQNGEETKPNRAEAKKPRLEVEQDRGDEKA